MQFDDTHFPLVTADSIFDTVVLCDGDYPTHAIPVSILMSAQYVCCCDKAALRYIADGNMPQVIIGDGDSLPKELQQKFAHIFKRIDEQDDNDQTKATRHCFEQGFKRIAYIGSTGKREDHTIGNISLLMRYYRQMGLDVTMITDYGYFTPAQGNITLQTFKGQQVSIFNMNCTSLSSSGLKWNAYAFGELWQGTLNEAMGNEVNIYADGYYMVFRTFKAKENI